MILYSSEIVTIPSTGELKYFARIVLGNTIRLEELASRIADGCTLTEADVMAVFKALERQIRYGILDGRPISLGSLGVIIPSISSETKDFEDEIDETCIKGIRLNYRKSGLLRRFLRPIAGDVYFHKQTLENKTL